MRQNSAQTFFVLSLLFLSTLFATSSAWINTSYKRQQKKSKSTFISQRLTAKEDSLEEKIAAVVDLASSSSSPSSSSVTSSAAKSKRKLSFTQHNNLIDAASSVIQDSCRLLGVKSVGVDYGLVRTGVAVTVGYEPKPLAILSDLNTTQACQEIIRYAKSEQAKNIVLGLPLHKNGTVAEQTNLTLQFGYELAKNVLRQMGPGVDIYLFDERYTSKEAAARAHSQDPSRFLYGTLDADAACIILENFYEDNGVGAHTLQLPAEIQQECLEYFQQQKDAENEQRMNLLNEREEKMRRRREAIARAMEEDKARQANGAEGSSKKRKKKKRR